MMGGAAEDREHEASHRLWHEAGRHAPAAARILGSVVAALRLYGAVNPPTRYVT